MAITNTFRWNGKLGSNWNALIPGAQSNWDLLDGTVTPPAFPESSDDLAVFDLGDAITVTAKTDTGDSGIGSAEEIQIVNASAVSLTQDFFSAGSDGSGGLIVDEASTLTIAQGATMVNEGSLDIVGLTTSGTLAVESGTVFEDSNLILGTEQDATGVATADGGFLFVVQTAPGSADGVLTVGENGDGSVTISGGGTLASASAILGETAGATGTVTIDAANWTGSTLLTIGQSGAGTLAGGGSGLATIENGSTVVFLSGLIGDGGDGSIEVTSGSQAMILLTTLAAQGGSTGNATIDDASWLGVTLDVGGAGTGNATIDSGSTVSILSSLLIGDAGDGSIDVTNGSTLISPSATLGAQTDSTGTVTLDDSFWSGTSLVVGEAGTGNAEIGSGSTVTFDAVSIGPNGEVDVTGTPSSPTQFLASGLTLNFGSIDVSGNGQVLMGATAGIDGAIAIKGGSSLVGLGTANGDVAFSDGGIVQAALAVPGELTINGNITGNGTLEPVETLEVNGGIGTGVDILFGPSEGDAVGDLVLDVPGANLGTIVGFGAGNMIDVEGPRYTDAVFTPGGTASPGTLTLSGAGFAPLSFAVEGTYAPGAFQATPGDSDTIVTLCFVAGTFIDSEFGEVKVEDLLVGDRVRCLRQGLAPIAWIGTGRVLATRGRRNAATPVIVRKGALADNVPSRDLHVTKGHSLYLDGVLIPVEFLVNHRSILWDDRAQEVTVYHIELASHDILLADGAPAESYRDDGNRWLFRNANSGWGNPPQPPCAPVLTGGPIVDATWRRLLNRAGPRASLPLTGDADLHLVVDGRRLDAVERVGEVHVFRLATLPSTLRIASRAAVPAELGLARDPRSLGVALRRVVVRQGTRFSVIEADDCRLSDGFHAFEPDNDYRWTDGDAGLPTELYAGFAGGFELVLHVGDSTRYLDDGGVQRAA